jgi:uncharacterized protein (DUF58 family)
VSHWKAETLGIVGGLAAGAGLMYLLDPDRGARRRARLRKQLQRAGTRTADSIHEARRRVPALFA